MKNFENKIKSIEMKILDTMPISKIEEIKEQYQKDYPDCHIIVFPISKNDVSMLIAAKIERPEDSGLGDSI
jgi:hypothetical protein